MTVPAEPGCAGVLLAAGGGRRMGGPKALVGFRGRLLVERAVAALQEAGCAPVVVVLGAGADEVRRRADLAGCAVVVNSAWADGQAGSLRIGLDACLATAAGAAVVALVDQPGVGPAVVARLVDAWRGGAGPAVVAAYVGRGRNPVLFDRSVWAEVAAAAHGDEGARAWLRDAHAHDPQRVALVECGDIGHPADLDTPADLDMPAAPATPLDIDASAAVGRARRNTA